GDYQDAMSDQHDVDWSLYHSRLSFSLNSKMISPREVIEAAIRTRDEHPERVSMSQLEGFVRQILGWREFVRGMYWSNMPGYPEKNELQHQTKLPSFYWDGNTHMRCVNKSVEQTIEYGYAHHIQRLMVLGNIANLLGINPYSVHEWFLSVYVDAIEWVEAPNVIGMALSADGGLIASKPYVSSGNYINKMSSYCKGCRYKPTIKTGENACPFNALYWDFLDRHRDHYGRNNRLAFAYKNLDRKPSSEMEAIRRYAEMLKQNADSL
ncbi:MAG: cryptochrome/photolyase family protein, partial [Gammaproteobacteria bacterium]|nr:cryptochrome/photolyase family protein [Gammaproteobacteria bacterium]